MNKCSQCYKAAMYNLMEGNHYVKIVFISTV